MSNNKNLVFVLDFYCFFCERGNRPAPGNCCEDGQLCIRTRCRLQFQVVQMPLCNARVVSARMRTRFVGMRTRLWKVVLVRRAVLMSTAVEPMRVTPATSAAKRKSDELFKRCLSVETCCIHQRLLHHTANATGVSLLLLQLAVGIPCTVKLCQPFLQPPLHPDGVALDNGASVAVVG